MKSNNLIVLGFVAIAAIAVLGFSGAFSGFGTPQSVVSPSGEITSKTILATADVGTCPDTKRTSVVFTNLNKANTSSTTPWTAATLNIYNADDGSYYTQITVPATSAGSTAVNLPCSRNWIVKPLRTDAANGQGSNIVSSDVGTVDNGNLRFTTTGSDQMIGIKTRQHATLQFQLYDGTLTRIYSDAFGTSSPQTSSQWNTTGVSYYTTASNSTAEALGTDDELTRVIYVKSVQTDTEFTDRAGLILVDADVSDYQEPIVKYNGIALTDMFDELNGDEAKSFSTYEYAYLIPASELLDKSYDKVEVNAKAASGVNPDVDVTVAFAARGQYASGTSAKVGAATDDATHTATYTLQTVVQQIS